MNLLGSNIQALVELECKKMTEGKVCIFCNLPFMSINHIIFTGNMTFAHETCYHENARHNATNKDQRIQNALDTAMKWGGIVGGHHKIWVIDQIVRTLTDCPTVQESAKDINGTLYTYETLGESEEYLGWVRDAKQGEEGPDTYDWDKGIAP